MSLVHIFLFFYNTVKLSFYLRNIQVDFGEGILLGNAERLTKFLTIYPDIKSDTILGVYPPLYQLLSAGMISVTGLNLASGRIISTMASLITAILIYKMVPTKDKLLKIIFPALYLSSPVIMTWGPLMRVDMLAVMFSVLGIYLFEKSPEKLRVPTAATALALSALTKQIMFAALAAIIICLLVKKSWKILAKFLACYLVVFLGTTALLMIITNGQYINHVYIYHLNHQYQLSRLSVYDWFLRTHLLLVVAAVMLTIYYLKQRKKDH
ncbi:MAG: glycosyltransferase family 39 protein [Nitrososphaerota archaeon]